MMKLRRMIKSKAHAAIVGSRSSAMGLIFVYLIVAAIINLADATALRLLGYEFTLQDIDIYTYSNNFFYDLSAMGISLLVWLVRMALVVPLGYGILNWYLELSDRRKHGVAHIFWPYECKAAIRGVLLSLNVAIKTTLLAPLLLIPPLALVTMSDSPQLSYGLSMTLVISGTLLTILALVLIWAFVQRFAIAHILLCEKYQLTVHQAIKASVRYTRGHRFELVLFELSFLPYILPLLAVSGMLTFSLLYDGPSAMPFVWAVTFVMTAIATYFALAPYYTMARVMYARYLYEYGIWQQNSAQPATQPQPEPPMGTPVQDEYPAAGSEPAEVAVAEQPQPEPYTAQPDTAPEEETPADDIQQL